MNKSHYTIPLAILAAGTMIAAAVYFQPAESQNAKQVTTGDVENEVANGEFQKPEDVLREMFGDDFEPIELNGWEPPADGDWTEDDFRRLIDAWEEYCEEHRSNWFDEVAPDFREHGPII